VIAPSFAELDGRERAFAVLDPGARELIGPFARMRSPHLAPHGIAAQSDDGVVVARGTLAGASAVAIATDGRFLGGSVGEVGGAKIAAALEHVVADRANGIMTRAILIFDTGGIRVQEANLAILALAEIHAAIVAARATAPVVALIGGRVGCFGGMGIAAGLCAPIVMSDGARLGLNGPEVVEQEAGIAELDARDRPAVWRSYGGRARFDAGFATMLVDDDPAAFREAAIGAYDAIPESVVR
jgi:malonate decarboxylase beta subunit